MSISFFHEAGYGKLFCTEVAQVFFFLNSFFFVCGFYLQKKFYLSEMMKIIIMDRVFSLQV